jgi:hypothetical protein
VKHSNVDMWFSGQQLKLVEERQQKNAVLLRAHVEYDKWNSAMPSRATVPGDLWMPVIPQLWVIVKVDEEQRAVKRVRGRVYIKIKCKLAE